MAQATDTVAGFPLQWPITVPRTKAADRRRSKFGQRTWDQCLAKLRRELALLGADLRSVVISTNQPVRKDGVPYAQARNIDDPGVAVYFMLDGQRVCFPCDRWITIAENLSAVTLHIESMRGQQRWGVGTARQAFTGYAALPASTEEPWWDVLGLRRETATRDDIQAAYRARLQSAHPDHGGSHSAMARLNAARTAALAEVQR